MALGVIIRISAFEYLPAQQRHTWSLCFSLSIGLSVRNNSLIVVPAHLQVRQDWLEANVFYSKHYLLDARSRDVTEERRAFSSIPRSDYRLSKLFHSYPKFPRTTLETSGTMTPYYPTALCRVQITLQTSTNITRYLYSRGPVKRVSCRWPIS